MVVEVLRIANNSSHGKVFVQSLEEGNKVLSSAGIPKKGEFNSALLLLLQLLALAAFTSIRSLKWHRMNIDYVFIIYYSCANLMPRRPDEYQLTDKFLYFPVLRCYPLMVLLLLLLTMMDLWRLAAGAA